MYSFISKYLLIFTKASFTINILLVYFFSRTAAGNCLFVFSILYSFFFSDEATFHLSNVLASVIVMDTLDLSIVLCVVLLIPKSRTYLINLLGEEFIHKYLPKKGFKSLVILIFIFFGMQAIELYTTIVDAAQNADIGNQVRHDYRLYLETTGDKYNIKEELFTQMQEICATYVVKRPEGIFRKLTYIFFV